MVTPAKKGYRKVSLIQLIYTSSLVEGSGKSLGEILSTAVRFNKANGITVTLICIDGVVIQALEGEPEVVHGLFDNIQSDTRHRGVFLLTTHDVPSRQFAAWSMGFREVNRAETQAIPKYAPIFSFTKGEVIARIRPGIAADLLSEFGYDRGRQHRGTLMVDALSSVIAIK